MTLGRGPPFEDSHLVLEHHMSGGNIFGNPFIPNPFLFSLSPNPGDAPPALVLDPYAAEERVIPVLRNRRMHVQAMLKREQAREEVGEGESQSGAKKARVDEEKKEPPVPKTPEEMYPCPPSCEPMTEDILKRNEEALAKKDEEVIVRSPKYIIRRDLASVQGWLNDAVIDCYLDMVQRRSAQNPGMPKVYCFNGIFYTMLRTSGGLNLVKGTARNEGIFDYDLLFFPVCPSNHWRLVVANVKEKMLVIYNSLLLTHEKSDKLIFTNILKYLRWMATEEEEEMNAILEAESSDADSGTGTEANENSNDEGEPDLNEVANSSIPQWRIERPLVPQQKNTRDCGAFILQFANYLSRGSEFDFTDEHIPYFRQRIMHEIITGTLLP